MIIDIETEILTIDKIRNGDTHFVLKSSDPTCLNNDHQERIAHIKTTISISTT